jgi:NDP-sugar pyrophosphorylase family protein
VQHLRRLEESGVDQVAVNLHHLPEQVERMLSEQPPGAPELTFFLEARILGTAGALRNAASFLGGGDFLVVNSDAAIAPDFARLRTRHRESGRAATLLVTENRHPDRYTPLQSEGDRIAGFGTTAERPLLYTGVCVLAPRLLARIPAGETALVRDLWQPLLAEEREEIGFVVHDGPFADLGRPGDFLRASLEALARGGPFPAGAGVFDGIRRVLGGSGTVDIDAADCAVAEGAVIGAGAILRRTAVWAGVALGAGARLENCLAARGRIAPGSHHEKALLWSADPSGDAVALDLSGLDVDSHGSHSLSPRR